MNKLNFFILIATIFSYSWLFFIIYGYSVAINQFLYENFIEELILRNLVILTLGFVAGYSEKNNFILIPSVLVLIIINGSIPYFVASMFTGFYFKAAIISS